MVVNLLTHSPPGPSPDQCITIQDSPVQGSPLANSSDLQVMSPNIRRRSASAAPISASGSLDNFDGLDRVSGTIIPHFTRHGGFERANAQTSGTRP